MNTRRYRLRTLLLITAFVAVGIVAFKPFAPHLSMQSLVAVPVAEPYSNFADRYRQYQLTVRNDGRLPLWLAPNEAPVSDDSSLSDAGQREPTYVELGIHKDNCTKLAAGQSRVYDLVVHSEYEQFRLFVFARDWRGREGYTHFGIHEAGRQRGGEPANAHE